ncbi:KGG domain-containing protein [Hymenobacter cellulosilyticus]|uniref:KGG domain-containing protein n=1 Tax=Hymenobacter cellulosilyticus TaxID=2932248 RepID=A0A8T9QAE7_9BACT|nr:KGG domain-containing protein [Hymenobacter cellulosilyticus]UOQ74125.1 KGG domain-containing protein [Hymenobacter cellulosilyticus]
MAHLSHITNATVMPTTRTTKKASETPAKRPRGFAAMDPETQRRIASEGGKASHESGRGHRFTSEEARAAGRKGGQASRSRDVRTGA